MSRRPQVSPNRLEGSLGDTPIDKLLESCKTHLITGKIDLRAETDTGVIELRAGIPDTIRFANVTGDAALERLRKLPDGIYELSQALPILDGSLGEGATGEGDLAKVPLVKMMRHCEDQALSCTITIVSEFDRAEIRYKVGEIVDVTWNGKSDLDAIVDVAKLTEGRFRLQSPPLPSDIDGWPSTRKDPTVPFKIEHLKASTKAKPAAAPEPTPAPAPAPEPAPVPEPAPSAPAPALARSASESSEPKPAPKSAPARAATANAAPAPMLTWDTALLAVIGLAIVAFWLVLLLYVR